MLDCLLASNDSTLQKFVFSDGELDSAGNSFRPPIRMKDGHMAIALFSHFDRMVQAMGHPDLLKDERLGTLPARYKKENFDYFLTIVREWAKDRTIEEASKLFEKYDVAFGKVNSVADIVRSPVVRQRKMLTEVELSEDARALVVNTPFRFSQSPCGPQGPPPVPGRAQPGGL